MKDDLAGRSTTMTSKAFALVRFSVSLYSRRHELNRRFRLELDPLVV